MCPSDNSDNSNNENKDANPLSAVLDGGLPQLLIGPAGKAISRLVGSAADIPAAWLEQKAQSIRDETNAKSALMETLTRKAGDLGAENPALLERGLNNLLGKAYREQENKERVAAIAIEDLSENPPNADSNGPDDDWLNLFEDQAARASSENLRELFGRILAGEVRKPGSFSLSTLHFVSMIDSSTARAIESALPLVWDGTFLLVGQAKKILDYEIILVLEAVGFLTIGADMISVTKPSAQDGRIGLIHRDQALIVALEVSQPLTMTVYPLTRAGQELFDALDSSANFQGAPEAVASWAKVKGVAKCQIVRLDDNSWNIVKSEPMYPSDSTDDT